MNERWLDPSRPYCMDRRVVIRPESVGAVAYHFGTRRAVFLHEPRLFEFLPGLERHPSLESALDALRLDPDERSAWEASLAHLVGAQIIHALCDPPDDGGPA